MNFSLVCDIVYCYECGNSLTSVCLRVSVCACVCACVRVCVRVFACVSVYIYECVSVYSRTNFSCCFFISLSPKFLISSSTQHKHTPPAFSSAKIDIPNVGSLSIRRAVHVTDVGDGKWPACLRYRLECIASCSSSSYQARLEGIPPIIDVCAGVHNLAERSIVTNPLLLYYLLTY